METVLSIVALGALVYVSLCFLLYTRQSSQIYFPNRIVSVNPGDAGMNYENLRLASSDGETIAAWYIPAKKKGAKAVLFCHGNGGDIGGRITSIETFHNLGYSVIIFDYPGYGESSGKPTELNTYASARAAWDYLVEEKKMSEDAIAIFGRSLGGAIAAELAEKVDPRVLVIESTFTSVPDMAAMMFPFLPSRKLCVFSYDTLSRIKNITCPVIVAHSPDDSTIPYEHGEKIFSAANEPKTFIRMAGDHNYGGIDSDSDFQKQFNDIVKNAR